MATGESICVICGSTEFDEENGVFYCSTCQTKLEGVVVINYEREIPQASQHLVNVQARKEPASQNTGYSWSSYEGFNLILIEQCKFLVKNLGLTPKIYQLVLALWANYLKKVEVAFIGGEVKLSLGATPRDIVNFVEKGDQTAFTQLKSREKKKLSSTDMISKRVCSKDVVIVDDVYTRRPASQPQYTRTGGKRVVESLLLEQAMCDLTGDESSDFQIPSTPFDTDDSIPWLEPEVVVSTQEHISKVPEEKMNKFSRELHRLMMTGKIEKPRRADQLMSLDRMSMATTLAFLLIAFRLLQLDVQIGDILNWVDCGYLPFYNALSFLPETWTSLKCDYLFSPRTSPSSEKLNVKASELCRFLKLLPLPPADHKKLMQRMLHELNLPLDLHLIIFENKFLLSKFQHLMNDRSTRKQCLPRYDVLILMVILVVLNKFYILDDEKQLLEQCSNCPNYLKTYNQFDPLFWIQYTRARVKALKHHFTPLWKEEVSSFHDIRVAESFYNQFACHWNSKVTQCKRRKMYDEDSFRDKMKQLISSVCERDDSEILLPQPSLTFLSDATAFVKDRVDKPLLRNILGLNFRHKSLAYLVKSSSFNNRHYEPIVKDNCDNHQLSEPVNLYLNLASWIVHEEKERLLLHLKMVEKLFDAHRPPQTRKPRRKSIKTNRPISFSD